MEEVYREFGRQMDYRSTSLYLVLAIVFGIFAYRSRSTKNQAPTLWGGCVGFALACLLNLPSPWFATPMFISLFVGILIGCWRQRETKRMHKWMLTGFTLLFLAGLTYQFSTMTRAKVVFSASTVTQYSFNGEEWGSVTKRSPINVTAFRALGDSHFLWTVKEKNASSNYGLHFSAKDLYWHPKYGIVNGDQLALRVAEWSGSQIVVAPPIDFSKTAQR